MEFPSDCPECGKQLSHSKKYCACGWKIEASEELAMVDQNCQYITSEGRCKELGTIAPRGMAGRWYCCVHWYKAATEQKK